MFVKNIVLILFNNTGNAELNINTPFLLKKVFNSFEYFIGLLENISCKNKMKFYIFFFLLKVKIKNLFIVKFFSAFAFFARF